MIAILCMIDFLWGLAIFPISNTLKKWVENTKSLPFGSVINFFSTCLLVLTIVCAYWLPLYLIFFFKSLNHGNNWLWSSLAFLEAC